MVAAATFHSSSSLVLGLALLVLLVSASAANAQQLSSSFYDKSCPQFRRIVRSEMRRWRLLGGSILRLFFHDCFILGCDASILLDGDDGEKNALSNRNSVRGFLVIDIIKARLERSCRGVVSCADILALAAREGIILLGGPSFRLDLGRRDSLTSSQSDANSGQLPGPFSSLDTLIKRFNDKGLTVTDMVALSGAHTIGLARCVNFRGRLSDSNIDPQFAARLRWRCPPCGDNFLKSLDPTPFTFDNLYFRNLLRQRGLLHSDQVLFNNGTTDSLVRRYAFSRRAFFRDFSTAMTKMSNINPLTGSDGEIRENCRVVN